MLPAVLPSQEPRPYPSEEQARTIIEIQHLLFDDDFSAAESLATTLQRQYPDEPCGYLFAAIALLTKMFALEENCRPSEFHRLLDSAAAKAQRILDTASSPTVRAWQHVYLGHVEAYRSLWESHYGSLMKAIKRGRRAKKIYEQGLAEDSTVYDLYFGLGLYHYWKSAKAGLLRWLGLIHNDKEKGIAQLRLAADSSLFSRPSAHNALLWILMDRKEYDSVIARCREMIEKYPHGKSFLWLLAQAYFEKKEYRHARDAFARLREYYASEPGNYFNLVECDYFLLQCSERLGDEEAAEKTIRSFRSYSSRIPSSTRRRQREKLSFLRRAART